MGEPVDAHPRRTPRLNARSTVVGQGWLRHSRRVRVANPGGLSQIAGVTPAGSQQTTFVTMTQFMGMLLDPSIDGRGDASLSAPAATPFAEESDVPSGAASAGHKRTGSEQNAYAAGA
jgi:hypothetical protein